MRTMLSELEALDGCRSCDSIRVWIRRGVFPSSESSGGALRLLGRHPEQNFFWCYLCPTRTGLLGSGGSTLTRSCASWRNC